LTVDLTGDQPRLWSPKNQLLVNNASINELLGETLGKYVNPVFANNKRAKGLLDVTIQECRGLALGQDMKTEKSGDVKILFSLTDMDIANPLGSLIGGSFVNSLGSFLGSDTDVTAGQSDTFEGEIKNGALSISKGVTNTDVTLMLVDPRTPEASAVKPGQKKPKPILMPMSFKGDIRLADLKQNLNVNIAPGLIGKFLPKKWAPKVADALPGGLPLVMRGTTPAPKIEWGDVVGKLGANLVGGEIGNLLGGDKDKKNNATKDGTKNPDNIGGVIGDILGGNKDQKKDDSKDASPPKKKKK
jgi:hypothetical protein